MITSRSIAAATIFLTFFLSLVPQASAQSATQGQTDTKTSADSDKVKQGGMMHKNMPGKMDVTHMVGMIDHCMGEHMDETVCDKKVLSNCEESKTPQECAKMMTDSKKKISEAKKTK